MFELTYAPVVNTPLAADTLAVTLTLFAKVAFWFVPEIVSAVLFTSTPPVNTTTFAPVIAYQVTSDLL